MIRYFKLHLTSSHHLRLQIYGTQFTHSPLSDNSISILFTIIPFIRINANSIDHVAQRNMSKPIDE